MHQRTNYVDPKNSSRNCVFATEITWNILLPVTTNSLSMLFIVFMHNVVTYIVCLAVLQHYT